MFSRSQVQSPNLLKKSSGAANIGVDNGGVSSNLQSLINTSRVENLSSLASVDVTKIKDGQPCVVSEAKKGGNFNYRYSVAHGITTTKGLRVRVNDDWYLERVYDVVKLEWFVEGDGIADDTTALAEALTHKNVVGSSDLTIRTTSSIDINNELDLNMAGATLLGETTADASPWLYIKSDSVQIYNGKFGDGTIAGKPIVIGDYSMPDNFRRNYDIYNNLFNVGALSTNKAVISGVGRCFEVRIRNNRFESGAVLSGNVSAIFMQLSNASVDSTTQLAWRIEGNTSIGFPYFFNNYSSAYCGNVIISKNTIRDGVEALRPYHIHDCLVSENIIDNCSGQIYIWQRCNFINNVVQGCGDGIAAIKLEAPTSTTFSGNSIRNSSGVGVVIDGGNSSFSFVNNNIYNSSGDGLLIDPTYAFGGQVRGLEIRGNRITENVGHAIKIKVTSALRTLTIAENYISGNGKGSASAVAAVYVDTSDNLEISRLIINGNIIQNNDTSGGIQNANTQYGLWFDGGTSFSSTYLFANNICYAVTAIEDDRTAGGGVGMVVNNYVQSLPDPSIWGLSFWDGNYTETASQRAHRRNNGTPVGVLTPLYLGEEVFDTSGQNWYKSVGGSLGPWTSSNWKQVT